MDWYSTKDRAELPGTFGRLIDVSAFDGDLQCAVDQLTTTDPGVPAPPS